MRSRLTLTRPVSPVRVSGQRRSRNSSSSHSPRKVASSQSTIPDTGPGLTLDNATNVNAVGVSLQRDFERNTGCAFPCEQRIVSHNGRGPLSSLRVETGRFPLRDGGATGVVDFQIVSGKIPMI